MVTASESAFRFEKRRADAVICLSNGESVIGCFFVGAQCAHHAGPERIVDLLNSEPGFLPFESRDASGVRLVLYNPSHIVTATVADHEPSLDPGHSVATRHVVSMLLSTGQRLTGAISVYRPEGQTRLSDWSKQVDAFHYLETGTFTIIVNAAHIVEVSEVPES